MMLFFWIPVGIAALVAAVVYANEREIESALLAFFAVTVLLFVFAAVSALFIDYVKYDRETFAAQMTCKQQRAEPERQFLTKNVVCVPAYRATKSDTLTLNGLPK